MVDVINSIADCLDLDGRWPHKLRRERWCGETVHRIKLPGHNDAAAIARFDRQQQGLGCKMAYTLIIQPDGTIEQALPFDRVGWHARSYSRTHIGIGCVGNFTKHAMPDEQHAALLEILTWCANYRGGVVDCFGHTERPDASNWKGHECPGVNVDMDAIRTAVAERVKDAPQLCRDSPPFVLTS